MTDRRYSDDEIAAIFQRAAEGPQLPAQSARTDGLTLPDLQEIGREVGIAPEAIARAAAALEPRPGGMVSRRFFGLPLAVERVVALDRRLSDSEWEQLVVELRQVFNAAGRVRADGTLRQWTNGNLQVMLEPSPTGQQLRLRTVKGNARLWMTAGAGLLGIAGAATLAGAAAGQFADSLSGTLVLWLMGLGLFAGSAIRLPAWARLRRRQMDAIAERVALEAGQPPDQREPDPG